MISAFACDSTDTKNTSDAVRLRIHLCEAIRAPLTLSVHSEWVDEAAFDAHSRFPDMQRFFTLVPSLITHPIRAIRTHQME